MTINILAEMANEENREERRRLFLRELADLLKRHSVDLNAIDDGAPYGMHRAFIEVEFVDHCEDFSSLTADMCNRYAEAAK